MTSRVLSFLSSLVFLPALVVGEEDYDLGVGDSSGSTDFVSLEACVRKLPEGRLKNFIAEDAPAFRNAFVQCNPSAPGKKAYAIFYGEQGETLNERVQLPDLDGEEMLTWMKENHSFEVERKLAVYKDADYTGLFDGHTIQFWALKDSFTGAFEHATMTPLHDVSGYLVHVETKEEREFINKILEEKLPGQNASIWVGAHNIANPGQDPQFRYLGGQNDGSVVNFEDLGLAGDWHFTHQPREGLGRDCLVYNYGPSGASWSVADCEKSTAYTLVEHDPVSEHGRGMGEPDRHIPTYEEGQMDTSHYREQGAQDPHYEDNRVSDLADDLEEGWRDEL